MNFYEPDAESIAFQTLSGELAVTRRGGLYEMDFPAYELKRTEVTPEMGEALGAEPAGPGWGGTCSACLTARRPCAPSRRIWRSSEPARAAAARHGPWGGGGLRVTLLRAQTGGARGPVCGSGHCHIAPYWAGRLGRRELRAYQASGRGGTLFCRVEGRTCGAVRGGGAVRESELHI